MRVSISATPNVDFDTAVSRTKELLAEQGFSVLTEVDVQATLGDRAGAQLPRHLVLGACNAPLARDAVLLDPETSLLLPCNVVIRETSVGTVVQAVNPDLLAEITGTPAVAGVAREASQRLRLALARLDEESS